MGRGGTCFEKIFLIKLFCHSSFTLSHEYLICRFLDMAFLWARGRKLTFRNCIFWNVKILAQNEIIKKENDIYSFFITSWYDLFLKIPKHYIARFIKSRLRKYYFSPCKAYMMSYIQRPGTGLRTMTSEYTDQG